MRSVRRRPNFVSLMSFSLAWGLLVFMLVLPFTASAANVTYETVRVGPGQYAPSGVTSPITVNVKSPGVSKYNQIVPVATPSTIGKLGRSLVRGGGVGFAITGAIEGLGYLIDQATGEIKKTDQVYANGTRFSSGTWIYPTEWNANGEPWLANAYPQCVQIYGSCHVDQRLVDGKMIVDIYRGGELEDVIIDLSPEDYQIIDNKLNTALSIAEKTAILRQALNAANLAGSFNSDNYPISLTGSSLQQQLFSDWPELQQSLQNLINAQIAAYLATVQPDFEVSPDDQVIVDNSLDFLPPDLQLPQVEFPPFCQWASWLCEPFIGGDQPDVPMLDLEAPNYDSGLPTGGTCPPPYTFTTGFTGPMEISFQPACDLATAIRTPLIAISYLMAGFIVVGVRR